MPHNNRRDRGRAEREAIRREILKKETPLAETADAAAYARLLELCLAVREGRRCVLGVAALHSSGLDVDSPVKILDVLPEDTSTLAKGETSLSLLAYAAKIGQDGCVAQLLHAGADPTRRFCPESSQSLGLDHASLRLRVKRLMAEWPAPYSVWVVCFVVKMREAGAAALAECSASMGADDEATCQLCGEATKAPLCWGLPCKHFFCEPCMWTAILRQHDESELTCPSEGCKATSQDHRHTKAGLHPGLQELRDPEPSTDDSVQLSVHASLERWLALPEDFQTSPSPSPSAKQKHKVRFSACSSLLEAHGLYTGLTRRQRSDEVMKACETGRVTRLRALFGAGANLEASNDYGETPLMVAAEAGHAAVVSALLALRADAATQSNGGLSTPLSCALWRGRAAVVTLLETHSRLLPGGLPVPVPAPWVDALSQVELESRQDQAGANAAPICHCLIPRDSPEEGADSWCIDEALGQQELQMLDQLFERLPEAEQREPRSASSSRRYLHDVEGWVCRNLARAVAAARTRHGSTGRLQVFPRMRFLEYLLPGGELPAHVDLNRTQVLADSDGKQVTSVSTHTFILYLTSCEVGGETRLLSGKDGEVIVGIEPRRGRLLLFPHKCWHEGAPTVVVPKRLLRGEMELSSTC